MTWLNGKPRQARSLRWPSDSPGVVKATKHYGTIWRREGSSVLNDRIAYYFSFRIPDEPHTTVVYLANAKDTSDPVLFNQTAELPYGISLMSLLPGMSPPESTIKLRTHLRDGTIVREISVPAQTAYGKLVVFQTTIAICISSGNPPPDDIPELLSDTIHYRRVDYLPGYSSNLPRDLVADQIVMWDTTQDHFRAVDIPQDPAAPIFHWADFHFITSEKIALAGCIHSSFGMDAGLLKCFSTQEEDGYVRTFAEGQHYTPESINRALAQPGSSSPSDILVHYHDSGSRVTVYHKYLVTGHISSSPTTDDPPGLHEPYLHPPYARTIKFALNGQGFPSISGNRILAKVQLGDNTSVIRFLDFDQDRLANLLRLGPSEREDLRARLSDDDAHVKVVTRRFNVDISDEEIDGEFLGTTTPLEWNEHLREMYARDEQRRDDPTLIPALEYDEPPEALRTIDVPLGYAESWVQLPYEVDVRRLAISSTVLVEVPEPGQQGWVFDFDE